MMHKAHTENKSETRILKNFYENATIQKDYERFFL
jgi:hypothetical protein